VNGTPSLVQVGACAKPRWRAHPDRAAQQDIQHTASIKLRVTRGSQHRLIVQASVAYLLDLFGTTGGSK
jgi:hypothetical protein